jgi:MFS family permease
MIFIAAGNLCGASAPNELVLLIARVIEGIGFFSAVLAIPSMLAETSKRAERDFVMAVWSAYMPAGIMLMLCAGPILPAIGWRDLWLANALVATGCAIFLAFRAPAMPQAAIETTRRFMSEVATVLRRPRCLLLAVAFFAYSCQIFSLAFALPLFLTSAHHVALGGAALLSASVLAVSAVGHVSSGFLLRAGVPIWASIAVAFGFFAVSDFAIYAGSLPPLGVAVVAAVALGVGGLAPGALYAAAPQAAPSLSAVAPTIGLLQQASNLGQFAGPVALGIWVQHFGWKALPTIATPVALIGLAAAFGIRRLLVDQAEVRSARARKLAAPALISSD